jgi:hypothetical protein
MWLYHRERPVSTTVKPLKQWGTVAPGPVLTQMMVPGAGVAARKSSCVCTRGGRGDPVSPGEGGNRGIGSACFAPNPPPTSMVTTLTLCLCGVGFEPPRANHEAPCVLVYTVICR